jgi:predicted kinase
MACWDPEVADQLAAQRLEDQLNPYILFSSSEAGGFGPLHWANGLVDLWDGEPHVHTLGLLRPGADEQLKRRIWRAHVQTIFPAVEQVRQAYVRAHIDILDAQMPFKKNFNSDIRLYHDPMTLEINDVAYLLRDHLTREQSGLLRSFKELRKSMAHMEPAKPQLIIEASKSWRGLLAEIDYPLEAPAWQWPRCGQRLTLLVGPSGAGKSTYAARTYLPDEVISSDAIREELFGTTDMAVGHERVFDLVRTRAKARLGAGLGAVIDATNLRQGERLANARLAPDDIGVEYVVIDRPQADKHRDGGWRSQRPGLIDGHSQMFARELPHILAGDGLPNVTVRDLRTTAQG